MQTKFTNRRDIPGFGKAVDPELWTMIGTSGGTGYKTGARVV